MHNPSRLAVEIDGNKLTISLPSGERVTYCKDPNSPMLVAADPMRGHLAPSRTAFLVEAWKFAYATAKEVGWLRS